jgi:hypothetical protein
MHSAFPQVRCVRVRRGSVKGQHCGRLVPRKLGAVASHARNLALVAAGGGGISRVFRCFKQDIRHLGVAETHAGARDCPGGSRSSAGLGKDAVGCHAAGTRSGRRGPATGVQTLVELDTKAGQDVQRITGGPGDGETHMQRPFSRTSLLDISKRGERPPRLSREEPQISRSGDTRG